jgi:hypothetical protein
MTDDEVKFLRRQAFAHVGGHNVFRARPIGTFRRNESAGVKNRFTEIRFSVHASHAAGGVVADVAQVWPDLPDGIGNAGDGVAAATARRGKSGLGFGIGGIGCLGAKCGCRTAVHQTHHQSNEYGR